MEGIMQTRLINNVSKETIGVLKRRFLNKELITYIDTHAVDAVGLVQGTVIEIICASDIASKASNVKISEIRGNCPQSIMSIGIIGDVSAVKSALRSVNQGIPKTVFKD